MSIAHDLANKFLSQLEALKSEKGDNIMIGDIDGLFKHMKSDRKDELYTGIQEIADKINTVIVEVSNPHPETISEKVPDAHLELDAIVQATEDATNTILDSVERIQNKISSLKITDEENAALFEEITHIFEACNFQDITGQRISKVVNTLIEIDQSTKELLEAISGKVTIESKGVEEKGPSDDDLMNGPQLDVPTQDDIDKLFAES